MVSHNSRLLFCIKNLIFQNIYVKSKLISINKLWFDHLYLNIHGEQFTYRSNEFLQTATQIALQRHNMRELRVKLREVTDESIFTQKQQSTDDKRDDISPSNESQKNNTSSSTDIDARTLSKKKIC